MSQQFQTFLDAQMTDGPDDDIAAQINAFIGEDGVAWELGPHPTDDTRDVFALSLSNRHETTVRVGQKLGLPFETRQVLGVYGIPPRDWDRSFYYTDPQGKEIEIDCAGWRYSLTKQEGKVMLTFAPDQDYGVIAPDLLKILISGELGEQNLHRYVARWEVGPVENGQPIEQLRADFRAAIPDCIFADMF